MRMAANSARGPRRGGRPYLVRARTPEQRAATRAAWQRAYEALAALEDVMDGVYSRNDRASCFCRKAGEYIRKVGQVLHEERAAMDWGA